MRCQLLSNSISPPEDSVEAYRIVTLSLVTIFTVVNERFKKCQRICILLKR